MEWSHTSSDAEPYWDITVLHVEGGMAVTDEEQVERFPGCDEVDWGSLLRTR